VCGLGMCRGAELTALKWVQLVREKSKEREIGAVVVLLHSRHVTGVRCVVRAGPEGEA